MTHLVHQDRAKLGGGEQLHQWQPQHQEVLLPAKYPEARHLKDGGVEVAVEQHLMDHRAVHLLAHLLQQGEEPGRALGGQ